MRCEIGAYLRPVLRGSSPTLMSLSGDKDVNMLGKLVSLP